MAITPITRDEFPQSSNAEAQAVSGLKEGTGIKFPCRWKHGGKVNACAGAGTLRNTTKRYGHTTRFSCRDGTLYVWRVA
jgi:hypothetical protein